MDAIREDDGQLDHLKATLERPVLELDLEAVTGARHLIEADLLQHGPAPAIEPTGQIGDGNTEDGAGVEASAPRYEAPHRTPVLDSASFDPARADHHVRAFLQRRHEARQVMRLVREVGVELEDAAVV